MSNLPAGQETENTRWICEKEIHDLLDQITVTHHAEYGFILTLPRESGNQFLVKLTDVARQAMRAKKAERELAAAKAQLNIASGIIHGLTVKLDTATDQLATAREEGFDEGKEEAAQIFEQHNFHLDEADARRECVAAIRALK